jgi:hypothetical protein
METNKGKRVLTSLLFGWPAYNKLKDWVKEPEFQLVFSCAGQRPI